MLSRVGRRPLSGCPRSLVWSASAVVHQKRSVGSEFLASKEVGDSRSLAPQSLAARDQKNQLMARENQEIMSALTQDQHGSLVKFRKEDRPWEIVPQYVKRRVVDMTGALNSEHRMEMEMKIQKARWLCDIELYVIVVPTVGYVSTRAFAKSIAFDWNIGGPRGNGVLLVVCQSEGSVQLITSPGLAEYFGQEFVDLLVKEVFQPLIKQGRVSYAVLQAHYAVLRHAHEVQHFWQNAIMPLPVKNKYRWAEQIVHYGAMENQLLWFCLALILVTAFIWKQVLKLMCPKCGEWLHRVVDDDMVRTILTDGQRMEFDNGCTEFFVQKCPKCKHEVVDVKLRDMYNDTRCLKCEECDNHTVSKETEIIRLATKMEDGLKRETYKCAFCRVGREIDLPLYRPLDAKPEESVTDKLLGMAADPKASQKQRRLV